MAARPVLCAGAVITDAEGRLLVVRRRNEPAAGRWSLPGGRVEPGETPAQAAAREVQEETGLIVEIGEEALRVVRDGWDIHDFAGLVVGGSLLAGDDAVEVRWVSRAELEALPTSPGLIEALRDADRLPA